MASAVQRARRVEERSARNAIPAGSQQLARTPLLAVEARGAQGPRGKGLPGSVSRNARRALEEVPARLQRGVELLVKRKAEDGDVALGVAGSSRKKQRRPLGDIDGNRASGAQQGHKPQQGVKLLVTRPPPVQREVFSRQDSSHEHQQQQRREPRGPSLTNLGRVESFARSGTEPARSPADGLSAIARATNEARPSGNSQKSLRNAIPSGTGLARTPMGLAPEPDDNRSEVPALLALTTEKRSTTSNDLARTPLDTVSFATPREKVPEVDQASRKTPVSALLSAGRANKAAKNVIPSGTGLARTPVDAVSFATPSEKVSSGISASRHSPASVLLSAGRANKAAKNAIPSGTGLARTPVDAASFATPLDKTLAAAPASRKASVPALLSAGRTNKAAKNIIPSGAGLARTPVDTTSDSKPPHNKNPVADSASMKASVSVPLSAGRTNKAAENIIPSGSGLARTPVDAASFATPLDKNPAAAQNSGRTPVPALLSAGRTNKAAKNVVPSGSGLTRTPVDAATSAMPLENDPATAPSAGKSSVPALLSALTTNKATKNIIPSGTGLARTPAGAVAFPPSDDAVQTRALEALAPQSAAKPNKPMQNLIPSGTGLARKQEQVDSFATALDGKSNESPRSKMLPALLPVAKSGTTATARNAIPSGNGLARTPMDNTTFKSPVETKKLSKASASAQLSTTRAFRNLIPSGAGLARTPVELKGILPVHTAGTALQGLPSDGISMLRSLSTAVRLEEREKVQAARPVVLESQDRFESFGAAESEVSHGSELNPDRTLPRRRNAIPQGTTLTRTPVLLVLGTQKTLQPKPIVSLTGVISTAEGSSGSFDSNFPTPEFSRNHDDEDDMDVVGDLDVASNDMDQLEAADQAYLRHLENARKLQQVEADLKVWKRRHQLAQMRLDEKAFKRQLRDESLEQRVKTRNRLCSWMVSNGVVEAGNAPLQPKDITAMILERATEVAHQQLQALWTSNETRSKRLARFKTEAQDPAMTPIRAELRQLDAKRQDLVEELKENQQLLGRINQQISSCTKALSDRPKHVDDEQMAAMEAQHAALQAQLEALERQQLQRDATILSQPVSSRLRPGRSLGTAKSLLRRVEQFLVRFESLRRTAKMIASATTA